MTGLRNELRSIGEQTNSRLSAVEKGLTLIDENINSKVKSEVSSMKTDIVNSIQKEMQDKLQDSVRQEVREIEDQKVRALNLICFNLGESESKEPEVRKEHDMRKFRELCSLLGVENVDIKLCFRLGNRHDGSTRPLKIILNNKKQRKDIVDRAFNIKNLKSNMKRCIITKDLTPRQREANKRRRLEAKKQTTKHSAQSTHASSETTGKAQTVSDESDYNDETVLDVSKTQSQNLLLPRGNIVFPPSYAHSDGRISPFSDLEDTSTQLQDSILNCSAIVQDMG